MSKTKNFLKSSFGNILEWYDFSIFAYYSVVLGKAFFPKEVFSQQLLMVFFVFGLGFLARPIGGYFFGKYGDKYGRFNSVKVAVYIMTICAFLIMILPSYNHWGIYSLGLLVLLRAIQGFSAGGQFSGVLAIAATDTNNHRSFFASLAYSTSSIGFLIAVLFALLLNFVLPDSLSEQAWRFAFGFGVFLGLMFFIINRGSQEGPQAKISKKADNTIATIIQVQWRAFSGVIILTAVSGCLYFFVFSYMYTYMVSVLDFKQSTAYSITIIQTFIGCLVYPIFGLIADRTNKQIVSIVGCILIIPVCFLVIETNNLIIYLLASIAMILCHAAVVAGSISIVAEVFFEKWKMTASGASYNIGIIAAGFFPMIAQFGIDVGGRSALILLLVLISIMGLVGHYLIRISKGHKLIT
jgi:MFS family permease